MTEGDRLYVLDAFAFWARSGFHRHELCDEVEVRIHDLVGSVDTEINAEFVATTTERLRADLDAQRDREAGWDDETINDRIDDAFDELWDRGIVALQNAGYTQSDGWDDANEAAVDVDEPRGAVFYHGQDTERAVKGDGLLLTFGAYSAGDDHDAASLEIGREVCEVLRKNGVDVRWDGTVADRIRIPPFEWRKRAFTEAP
ncbi:MAG: hypothetical protein ABMB14_33695 [Myxococcota bacterium]